ncbi:hypothetical protein PR1_34 [Providencia phage vB_PreS_PR1]|uniref:Uncharacterized protein n=1 Tax=Providencia phage vB_PreS_PR1 TaxID=1931407 RepID=A0A1S6KVA9_9CAUD|nr:hypothetical protein FDH30_gp035 [Providencia phage vB_PreS_PR1]AQT25356.2 hypothetical protein PR1_34 [Providencia phage vB_PreS_PR1]
MTQELVTNIEKAILEDAKTFPLHKFLTSSGTLNHRKIKQLQPWHQQDALNAYFILQATRYHGELFYGYREVEYVRGSSPVKIWCPDHEDFFMQRASTHMDGHSCPHCAKRLAIRHTELGDFEVPAIFHRYRITDLGIQFYNRFKTLDIEV